MINFNKIKIIFPMIFFCIFFITNFSSAENIKKAKDVISTSAPSATTTHVIRFTTLTDIPASSTISIIPESGKFVIPSNFNYTNMEFFVATTTEIATKTKYIVDTVISTSSATIGTTTVITTTTEEVASEKIVTSTKDIFVKRYLSDSATSTYDVVYISSGLSGKIDIFLNSKRTIYAGSRVKIILGDNNNGIINPSNVGAYNIDIINHNKDSVLISDITLMIAIVEQVSLNTGVIRTRSNGAPDGTLVGGTTQTIMSLITNFPAHCRYSTASGTPYGLMTDSFNTSDDFFHSIMLNDLESGAFYSYYVRCDDNVDDYTDDDDYLISFYIETTGNGGTGGGTGGGNGGGNGGSNSGGNDGSGPGTGGGSGGGTGNSTSEDSGDAVSSGGGGGIGLAAPDDFRVKIDPNLSISGWSYSGSEVVSLQDGVEVKRVTADNNGRFEILFEKIKKGVYTYGLWAKDANDIKSKTYSTTFWMEDNTKTDINDIILPPTIQISSSLLETNGSIIASGQSVPNSQIEVWYYPYNNIAKVVKKWVQIDENDQWTLTIPGSELDSKKYNIKARTNLIKQGYSDFSDLKSFSTVNEEEICKNGNADLNNDGSVNLVDFSILMYNWGSDSIDSDINCDGKNDLVDFSILMYNWTG